MTEAIEALLGFLPKPGHVCQTADNLMALINGILQNSYIDVEYDGEGTFYHFTGTDRTLQYDSIIAGEEFPVAKVVSEMLRAHARMIPAYHEDNDRFNSLCDDEMRLIEEG